MSIENKMRWFVAWNESTGESLYVNLDNVTHFTVNDRDPSARLYFATVDNDGRQVSALISDAEQVERLIKIILDGHEFE